MSSQSGYHSTDDFEAEVAGPPPQRPPVSPENPQMGNDVASMRDRVVSSESEIAYWKTQLDQSKQDMVEILGHAENLSQACEDLEDEVAALKAENAKLAHNIAAAAAATQPEEGRQGRSGARARVAAGLDGEGEELPLIDLVGRGGVAQQLTAVSRRIRSEQRRGDADGEAGEEEDAEQEYEQEQLSLLAQLLEAAARELLEQATDLATEKEAHDVTAQRLAMQQKKYAVIELRDSVRAGAKGSSNGAPARGSPAAAAPRSARASPSRAAGGRSAAASGSPSMSRRPRCALFLAISPRSPSFLFLLLFSFSHARACLAAPRSASRGRELSPNGSNWDETLRQGTATGALSPGRRDASDPIDHSRPRPSPSARRRNPYPSPAPSPGQSARAPLPAATVI